MQNEIELIAMLMCTPEMRIDSYCLDENGKIPFMSYSGEEEFKRILDEIVGDNILEGVNIVLYEPLITPLSAGYGIVDSCSYQYMVYLIKSTPIKVYKVEDTIVIRFYKDSYSEECECACYINSNNEVHFPTLYQEKDVKFFLEFMNTILINQYTAKVILSLTKMFDTLHVIRIDNTDLNKITRSYHSSLIFLSELNKLRNSYDIAVVEPDTFINGDEWRNGELTEFGSYYNVGVYRYRQDDVTKYHIATDDFEADCDLSNGCSFSVLFIKLGYCLKVERKKSVPYEHSDDIRNYLHLGKVRYKE